MNPQLELGAIRLELERLEHFIIIALAGRNYYLGNAPMYQSKAIEGIQITFLDDILRSKECADAPYGRYQYHQEVPFTDDLPPMKVKRNPPANPLHPVPVNYNDALKQKYVEFISSFCGSGDDGQYGSAATYDVQALQELSRRIHLGRHVAEAKFQDDEAGYASLIRNKDGERIMAKLTDTEQERRVIRRVGAKAVPFGLSVTHIKALYSHIVIPLTKDVEVAYLLGRLNPLEAQSPLKS